MSGKIIVVDNCNTTKKVIQSCLKKDYKLIFAQKKDLFDILQKNKGIKSIFFAINPKELTDLQLLSFLKSNFISFGIPIIFLIQSFDIKNFLSVVKKKKEIINNFLKKPIDPLELKLKLLLTINDNSRYSLNPLTQLPGNTYIYNIINERLKTPLAIFYLDLDNFKAYNDKYGFKAGDNVIKQTAQIIKRTLKKYGNPTDFIGHLGGDDFIILSTPAKADKIAQEICSNFDKQITTFYNKTDLKNKKIILKNRNGKLIKIPLLSLSIAIITNERKKLTCIAQISQIASELKKYAKTKPDTKKSNFVKERRSI